MIFEVHNDRIFTSVCGNVHFKCLFREDRVLLTVFAHSEAVAQTVISQKCGDKEGLWEMCEFELMKAESSSIVWLKTHDVQREVCEISLTLMNRYSSLIWARILIKISARNLSMYSQ